MHARAALDSIGEQDRDRAEVRIPAAAIHPAEGSPEEATELLVPRGRALLESPDPDVSGHPPLLFHAAPREDIGDRRGAEASLERALD